MTGGRTSSRLALVGCCIALAAGYGWAALRLYWATSSSTTVDAAYAVGPNGRQLADRADAAIERSRRILNDRSLSTVERIEGSRASLLQAEAALLVALRTRPTDASTLARYAAARWERDPPRNAHELDRALELIQVAGEMARDDPRVQRSLTELLLRAGQREPALRRARRTVDLRSTTAGDVVDLLADHGFSVDEILGALTAAPEVLIALKHRFFADADDSRAFVALVDRIYPRIEQVPEAVFPHFAAACLRLGESERLLRTVERLLDAGRTPDGSIVTYHVRALVSLGRAGEALAIAQRAFERDPDSAAMAALVGDTALSAERYVEAREAFRAGLTIVARGSGSSTGRARFYRSIGRAEEALGRGASAFDAYRLAVEANGDAWSARRLEALRAAPPSRPSGSR